MSPQTLVAALLIVQTGAKMIWTPGDLPARRLAIHTQNSHTSDPNDPNCIVGGYDDITQVVYVGGPCSQLDANNEPMTGFRYAAMKVVHADFADSNGPTATYTQLVPTVGAITGATLATHAEVGSYGLFGIAQVGAPESWNAKLFASQTSYLALSTVSFNTVDFVVSHIPSFVTLNVCTQECGTPSGDAAVACSSGCPSAMTTAVPGDYKFSIFAAAYNDYFPGMTGWEGLVAAYGQGSPKQLVGVFNVYQFVDFTNMGADTLTIASGGSSTLYADMAECSLAGIAGCTFYPVSTIALGADGWEGLEYEFPPTYNRGTWNNPTPIQGPATTTTTVDETKSVTISALKPDAAWKTDPYVGAQATDKLILLRYTFDVTGITASADFMSGKWIVYDPSVRTPTAAAAARANSGGTGTASTSGSVSRGCFAASLVAVLFMAAKL